MTLLNLNIVMIHIRLQKWEAVDDFLSTFKFVPDWFVASKMIKNIVIALYADENIIYFNDYSGDSVFSCNEIAILSMDLTAIIPDDTNYDEHDPETIIHIRLMVLHIKFDKRKAFKKRRVKN